jgi:hypothetical protein
MGKGRSGTIREEIEKERKRGKYFSSFRNHRNFFSLP